MSSGYIIVRRYHVLYEHAQQSKRYEVDSPDKPVYAVPWPKSALPPANYPQYRGIDREPLQALSYKEAAIFNEAGTPQTATPATALLSEIWERTDRDDGWLTTFEEALEVWNLLNHEQSKYEIIFAKETEDPVRIPPDHKLIGFDAAYFVSDHFSCICDSMFFPRWHGTDKEGVLFSKHFSLLNSNGLFDTNREALDFLRYYVSFDWTEKDENFTGIAVYELESKQLTKPGLRFLLGGTA